MMAAAMAAGMQAGRGPQREPARRGCGCLPWWMIPIILMLPCDLAVILVWLNSR